MLNATAVVVNGERRSCEADFVLTLSLTLTRNGYGGARLISSRWSPATRQESSSPGSASKVRVRRTLPLTLIRNLKPQGAVEEGHLVPQDHTACPARLGSSWGNLGLGAMMDACAAGPDPFPLTAQPGAPGLEMPEGLRHRVWTGLEYRACDAVASHQPGYQPGRL